MLNKTLTYKKVLRIAARDLSADQPVHWLWTFIHIIRKWRCLCAGYLTFQLFFLLLSFEYVSLPCTQHPVFCI